LVKNQDCGQKPKLWSKIDIVVKNKKFWWKINYSVTNQHCGQNKIFGKKIKILAKKKNVVVIFGGKIKEVKFSDKIAIRPGNKQGTRQELLKGQHEKSYGQNPTPADSFAQNFKIYQTHLAEL